MNKILDIDLKDDHWMDFSIRFWPTFELLMISLNSVALPSMLACLANEFLILMSSRMRPTKNANMTTQPIKFTKLGELTSVDYEGA